jgi:hypothetical protein
LKAKTEAIAEQVNNLAPDMLHDVQSGIEEGKMSKRRRVLVSAAERARKCGCMVVAADLSRFIRAEQYHRTANRLAWPTAEEFRVLSELTGGVVLTTVEDPKLDEDERHSIATRRTGKAGRPRVIDDDTMQKIVGDIHTLCMPYHGNKRWSPRLGDLAQKYKVGRENIMHMLARESPSGGTWLEVWLARAREETYGRGVMYVAKR